MRARAMGGIVCVDDCVFIGGIVLLGGLRVERGAEEMGIERKR